MKKRFLGIVSFVLAAMLMVMPVYAATGSSASADWTQKGDEECSYEVFNLPMGLAAVFRITRKPFSTTFPKVEEIIQEEDKKLSSAYIECEDGHTTVSKEDISKIFKYADSEEFCFFVFGIFVNTVNARLVCFLCTNKFLLFPFNLIFYVFYIRFWHFHFQSFELKIRIPS